MAAEYISNHFSDWGVSAIDDNQNYLQEFDLINLELISASINNGTLYKDFIFYNLNNLKLDNQEFIFVGYGIEEGTLTYNNLDVKNKIVLFLEGEPTINEHQQ